MAATVKRNIIGKRIRVLSQKNSGKFDRKKGFGRSEMSSTRTLGERVEPRSFKRSHALPQQFLGFVYVCGVSSSEITVSRVTNVLSVLLIFSGV